MSIAALSIKQFIGRLIIGLPCCLSLHIKWKKTYPKLYSYSLMDQFFTFTIYIAGQLWIALIAITGDVIVAFQPSSVLLKVFLVVYWTKYLVDLYISIKEED
jgi:hypothetical protein